MSTQTNLGAARDKLLSLKLPHPHMLMTLFLYLYPHQMYQSKIHLPSWFLFLTQAHHNKRFPESRFNLPMKIQYMKFMMTTSGMTIVSVSVLVILGDLVSLDGALTCCLYSLFTIQYCFARRKRSVGG